MTPWYETRRLAPGLTVLTEPAVHDYFRANMFFLQGRDRDLLVDCGMGLVPLSPHLPTTLGKPLLALATHCHVDHVGALHEFADRAGPLPEEDAFRTMRDGATLAHLFRAIDAPVERQPFAGFRADAFAQRPAPLTRLLHEGDRIDLGDRVLRVLHLPGHSPGSIGLLDERDGLFFSGDAIYPGGLVDDLPGCDPETYRLTMRRIRELDVRIAHGGHGHSLTRAEMVAIADDYLNAPRG